MAFSNRAIDGEPKPPSLPMVELQAPWRRYCGSGQLFGADDPSGKWRKLFKKQEEYDFQLKKLSNLTQDFTRRAIVQVRRERVLKTRRDAHAMFKAHCDASKVPPPPEIGSFESLRRGKIQTPLVRAENQEKTLSNFREHQETLPAQPTPPVQAKLPPGLQAMPGLAFLTSVDELELMLAREFQRPETPIQAPRNDDSSDDDDGAAEREERVPWAAADAELRSQALIARRGPLLSNTLAPPTKGRQTENQHSCFGDDESYVPRLFTQSPQPLHETRSNSIRNQKDTKQPPLVSNQSMTSYTLADTHHHDDFTMSYARVGKAAPQRSVAEHLARASLLSHRRPTAESPRALFQAYVPSPPVYTQPVSSSAPAGTSFPRTRRPMTAR